MGKEGEPLSDQKPLESNLRGLIAEELKDLQEFVNRGLYEAINSEFFPLLTEHFPHFLKVYKMDAKGARMNVTQRGVGYGLLEKGEFDDIRQDMGDEKELYPYLSLNDQEREALATTLFLGDEGYELYQTALFSILFKRTQLIVDSLSQARDLIQERRGTSAIGFKVSDDKNLTKIEQAIKHLQGYQEGLVVKLISDTD